MSELPSKLPGLSGSLRTLSRFGYEPISLEAFFGGWSLDRKLATKAPQFYYSRHIDFRKKPSQFTVLPGGTAEASGTVKDLVLDMTQIGSGERYAVGDAGMIYHVSTSGVWSSYGSLNESSGAGILYRSDVDHTYITGQTAISRIRRTANAPILQSSWFQSGISNSSTCYKTGGNQSYTPPTAIVESAANLRPFTADIEPLIQIGVRITAKGTGDWTLTLHNDANDILGTVTISNANIKAGLVNYFVFSGPIRLQRGDNGGGAALTYHFHITSTVADGVMATTTASSLVDADMELWANALVAPANGLHPMINFLNYTLIGNSNYVAQYEPLQDNPTTTDFLRHRLTFPPGYEVCGFAQKNLLCVIGCEKRSSTGEFQDGALFFWDGISDFYNDWWPVPEGAPESLYSADNVVYFMAGGQLYYIKGVDQPVKIRAFRGTDTEFSGVTDSIHCYPHMMTVRRGILLMGYPSYTTSQSLEHAVYSLGQSAAAYPVSFGLSYSLSTGSILNNGSNNLKLGMVKNFGDTLYISWRDDSASPQTYGVDVTNNSSAPKAAAQIDSILFDGGRPTYPKKVGYLMAACEPLPAGASFKLKYKLDREANWHYSDDSDKANIATAGMSVFVWSLEKRFYQLEHGLDLTVGATTPVILFLGAFVDLQILEAPRGQSR